MSHATLDVWPEKFRVDITPMCFCFGEVYKGVYANEPAKVEKHLISYSRRNPRKAKKSQNNALHESTAAEGHT